MGSYFKQRPVIITYALLALSFILIIDLFIAVHSNTFKPDKEMASKDDILGVNITVNSLTEKLKEIKDTAKKIGNCDIGWQYFDLKCYFFSNIKSNWNRARSFCVQKNADLAVINNEKEQRFLSSITGNMPYWIGLTDNESEGNWTWVDGTDYKTSFKSWSPNEPDNSGGNEDCAQFSKQGNWNDESCHQTSPYAICEKKL